MSQNISSAVMQQRKEPADSLDFFPTPPWATRALVERVFCPTFFNDPRILSKTSVWEPACGEGHMVRPLAEYFDGVLGTDVRDYGAGFMTHDFLMPGPPLTQADWIITNPPFRLAAEFVKRGLEIARAGVAMLVRTAFLEGAARYENLFLPYPPFAVAQFAERVPMVKGRYDPAASTATSYCWIVWFTKGPRHDTRLIWIPPCRSQLMKPWDVAVA